MPPVEVPERAVRALVERWFPGQAVVIARMGQGVSTPVYRVTVGDAVGYLRLAEKSGERRDAEVRVHEMVRDRGISVPEILRWEREPAGLDRSAALTGRMPGIPLNEFAGDATSALRQAGRDLARINAIPVIGYGWVDYIEGADRYLVAEHVTREAWTAEHLVAADTVIAATAVPAALHAALREAVQGWTELPDQGTSHLAHGDFDMTHIYVDPGTGSYQGLIDFGEIRGADPLYDLGQALANAGDEPGQAVFNAIVTGYGEIEPVDSAAVRLQAIAIATRALAIQLDRTDLDWRAYLALRLTQLLGAGK